MPDGPAYYGLSAGRFRDPRLQTGPFPQWPTLPPMPQPAPHYLENDPTPWEGGDFPTHPTALGIALGLAGAKGARSGGLLSRLNALKPWDTNKLFYRGDAQPIGTFDLSKAGSKRPAQYAEGIHLTQHLPDARGYAGSNGYVGEYHTRVQNPFTWDENFDKVREVFPEARFHNGMLERAQLPAFTEALKRADYDALDVHHYSGPQRLIGERIVFDPSDIRSFPNAPNPLGLPGGGDKTGAYFLDGDKPVYAQSSRASLDKLYGEEYAKRFDNYESITTKQYNPNTGQSDSPYTVWYKPGEEARAQELADMAKKGPAGPNARADELLWGNSQFKPFKP